MRDDLRSLRDELLSATHLGRIRRMLELGRLARSDSSALALVDALSGGDVFERRCAMFALGTLGDGGRLLPFTRDVSRSLRSWAFTMVPRICDDIQALEALRTAYGLHRDRDLLTKLWAAKRSSVVTAYLDWLATQPGLHDFADIVPMASPEGVRRHLERALARPSATFWRRLGRRAPAVMASILEERLRAVPGEPDAVTRQLIAEHVGWISERAPDEAIALLDLLFARGIFSHADVVSKLAVSRPEAALDRVIRYGLRLSYAAFAKCAPALSVSAIVRIVHHDPSLLGDAGTLVARLTDESTRAVTAAWCEVAERFPRWGFPLLGRIDDPTARQAAALRWSVSARDANGVVPVATVGRLPDGLRELEARRHLHDVVALATRPSERIAYARFLPWAEAEAELAAYIGHPEGQMRGIALDVMLAIPALYPKEPELVGKALAMVTARKNEQDPVRCTMLGALVAWPRAVWLPEHTKAIGAIVRAALDAGDLSQSSAQQAEALILRTFRLDPAWGMEWLTTLIKERGGLRDEALGKHLDDDDVRSAAPRLFEIAEAWIARGREYAVMKLAESLGTRLVLVPRLPELLEKLGRDTSAAYVAQSILALFARVDAPRYEATLPATLRLWFDRGWGDAILAHASRATSTSKRQPPLPPEIATAVEKIARGQRSPNHHVVTAVTLLRVRAQAHFDRILGDLLEADESYVTLPVVAFHLHMARQDLLTPFLGQREIQGRFVTGKAAVVLPFTRGFHRWNSVQNTIFAESLASIVFDMERDTPAVWRALETLAAMDSAPMTALSAAADDTRTAVKERAIRVMARADRGQCVPTLLKCLEDERARIAIYGLRRAIKDMLPQVALRVLSAVPMSKVTVAKEVVRLTGELRVDEAYARLVVLDGEKLHRDVRIALLRALWDHLDREPTWGIFARAVSGEDWVMAARLGDIPADRLTRESDRRLSALLGSVLDRPEPEARIDLLSRAAYLSVSDPERSFLSACASRLVSIYDDEVTAATRAILHRSTEDDLTRLPELLARATGDPRCLHVATSALVAVPLASRASWRGVARAADEVLARDPRFTALRMRVAAAAMGAEELAQYIDRLGREGALSFDTLEQCRVAISALPAHELTAVVDVLRGSPSAEARRACLWALVRDASQSRGWQPESLERLAALVSDSSPLVAGAALAVFPPREAPATKEV